LLQIGADLLLDARVILAPVEPLLDGPMRAIRRDHQSMIFDELPVFARDLLYRRIADIRGYANKGFGRDAAANEGPPG
jgi:hypothetical protein